MYILVVDDDSVVRMTLRTVLTSDGHTVAVAPDGEVALTAIALNPIDLVITDIYMPKVGGVQLRNLIREIPDKAHLPFLFISGYDDSQTTKAVVDPKLEAFFKKGGALSDLLAWVTYLTTPVHQRSPFQPGSHAGGENSWESIQNTDTHSAQAGE